MEVFNATAPQRLLRPPPGQKIFTLQQANRTLPLVSRIMADVVELDRQVCALEQKRQSPPSGMSPEEAEDLRERYLTALDQLDELRAELSSIGCQLKDWRRGLVDFLAIHNGRLVELCWRLGEKRIGHWHEAGAGFGGRQPIAEEFGA